MQVASEEKTYKAELSRQQNNITRLTDELGYINIQLKEKEQAIRINEIKLKELAKINKQSHEKIKKNILMKDQEKEKEVKNPRALSANMKIKTVQKKIINKPEQIMSKTPNYSSTHNVYKNKPFEIRFKKNYEKKDNRKDNFSLPSINSNQIIVDKDEMLTQIENLSKFLLYL